MTSLFRLSPILALLLLSSCGTPTSAPVSASARSCAVPSTLTPAPIEYAPADEIVHDEPTDHYLLAVSWSPEACRSGRDYPDAENQCGANAFGLTLHGLWPNGADRRHPRYCEAAAPTIAPATVRRHFCMTPSPALLQHEWAAHGTCGWDTPEAYFDQAARMWDALNRPDLEAIPAARLTAGAVRDAFAEANPGMPREAVNVITADGDWLREVRICHGLDFRVMACARPHGAPDEQRLRLAPRARG